MSVNIVIGSSDKPEAAKELADTFKKSTQLTGNLYIAFPMIPTPDGPFPIDAIYISKTYGLILINLVEGNPKNDRTIISDQDNSFNKMESKLKSFSQLTSGRNLLVQMDCLTFAPLLTNPDSSINTFNTDTLDEVLKNIKKNDYDDHQYAILTSVIQNISNLKNRNITRNITKPESRGAKLKKIEESIANLDSEQSKAVIESVDNVQRIRGLAGSGKTIVIALKAAYLHARHPEWKIAVTFNTRSLKNLYKKLITNFYLQQTGEVPNFKNLLILHAWGSSGKPQNAGMYFYFCGNQDNNTYRDFKSARSKFGYNDAFSGACKEAIKNKTNDVPLFDAILVDEAQDFSKYFLQICYFMLKKVKRLVYAYDELQNLSTQTLPGPEKVFGNSKNGQPLVHFTLPSQDIILKKCYRNPRPILVTAHALGFGIYRHPDERTDTGLLQMFENKKLWTDIGYFNDGPISDNSTVNLYRDDRSSPAFLEKHSSMDDLLQFHSFKNSEEQAKWITRHIETNIKDDELSPSDIVVINPNPLTTYDEVGIVRSMLLKKGINSNIAGSTDPDVFSEGADSVTFTGIYRVKGNEAAMVYVMNSEECYDHHNQVSTYRNILFTAMTRSTAWLRLTGIGHVMDSLIAEAAKTKEHDYRLKFLYPDKETRNKLRIINRDLSVRERSDLNSISTNIANIADKLSTGRISLADLQPQQLEILKELIKGDSHDKNQHS